MCTSQFRVATDGQYTFSLQNLSKRKLVISLFQLFFPPKLGGGKLSQHLLDSMTGCFFLVLLSRRVQPCDCPPFCFLLQAPIALTEGLNASLHGPSPSLMRAQTDIPTPLACCSFTHHFQLFFHSFFSSSNQINLVFILFAFLCICNRRSPPLFHSSKSPFPSQRPSKAARP